MSNSAMKYYSMDLRDLRKLCINKSLTGITRRSNRQQCINSLTSNNKRQLHHRLSSLKKNNKPTKIEKDLEEKEEESTDIILENYLKSWKLGQYINILIGEQGYDDIADWNDLTLLELQSMGFKPGHSKKFKRKTNEYFMQKRKLQTANSELRNPRIPLSTQSALFLDILNYFSSDEDSDDEPPCSDHHKAAQTRKIVKIPKYFNNKLNRSNEVDLDDESHSESEDEASPIYHKSPSKSQSQSQSNANTRKSTSDMIASIAKPQYHSHKNVNVTPNVPMDNKYKTYAHSNKRTQSMVNEINHSHSHSQSPFVDTVKHITYYMLCMIIIMVVALLYCKVGRDDESEYEDDELDNGNLMFAISKMTHYEPGCKDNILSSNDGDGNREGNSNLFLF